MEAKTGFIIALIVGGLVGWLGGLAAAGDTGGNRRYVVFGILGALLGGLVLGPIIGGGNLLEAEFDPMTPVVTGIGAVAAVFAALLIGRRRAG